MSDSRSSTQSLTVAHATDTGRQKASNQDCVEVLSSADLGGKVDGLYIVADGHGDVGVGEIASATAVSTIKSVFSASLSSTPNVVDETWIAQRLASCMERANSALRAVRRERGVREEFGSTCIAAVAHNDKLTFATVGDSRAYILSGEKFIQLTVDHAIIVAAGPGLDAYLTRALGWEDQVEVETFTCPFLPGDVLLMSSDGLDRMLEEDDILRQLAPRDSVDQMAARLVKTTNARGGYDNISVVVVCNGAMIKRPPSRPFDKIRGWFSR